MATTTTTKYIYVLLSKLSDKALDVASSNTDPGSRVVIWSKNHNPNQQWYDDEATGTIRTKLNDFCLELEGTSNLRINPYQAGNPIQQWKHEADGYIRQTSTGKVLEIIGSNPNDGVPVGLATANGGLNQLWITDWINAPPAPTPAPVPEPVPEPVPQPDPNTDETDSSGKKAMRIVSAKDGKVLDVKTAAVGTRIGVLDKDPAGPKSQQWYADANGYIRSIVNDVAIDAPPNTLGSIQPFDGSPNQQWKIDNVKYIKNASTGEYLDLYTDSTHGGTETGSYRWNDCINQEWSFEYV